MAEGIQKCEIRVVVVPYVSGEYEHLDGREFQLSHPCLLPRKGIPMPDDPQIGGKVKAAVAAARLPENSVAEDSNSPALLMAKREGLELELCIGIEFKQDSADSTQ